MRVALNLVYLVPGETGGMETYARELIPRLAATPGVEVRCLVNEIAAADRDAPWGSAAPLDLVPVDARDRVQWVRGEQVHVPRLAAAGRADLVHNLASTGPVRGVPRVTTVHDLNYRTLPEAHFGLRALGMRVLVPAAARRSRRVIVDATVTRDDVVAHLGLPADRVDVVPLGVSPRPALEPTPEAELRARLGLGARPVVLSVSAKRPHKNLARLLDALALLPPERRPIAVIPGYPTPHEAELRAHAADVGVADDVVWPEWLDTADLEGLYALAAAVVFPSLVEGFGLPVAEGMARGVPVATSNRSSMPEVAGGAALLFDPEAPASIAGAIEALLGDRALAARLRAAGLVRAAELTWDRTAALTVDSYRRALAAGPDAAG
jgi:glycosyltransferase involved in cell wall biosynthesis